MGEVAGRQRQHRDKIFKHSPLPGKDPQTITETPSDQGRAHPWTGIGSPRHMEWAELE